MKNKNYFKFSEFSELETGDVFKFSNVGNNGEHSVFYTVIKKERLKISISVTYGKMGLGSIEIFIGQRKNTEVLIYPDRKREIHEKKKSVNHK